MADIRIQPLSFSHQKKRPESSEDIMIVNQKR